MSIIWLMPSNLVVLQAKQKGFNGQNMNKMKGRFHLLNVLLNKIPVKQKM